MTIGSACVIGATGQIGRAAVRALAAGGWRVRAASRGGGRDLSWPAEVVSVAVDRDDDAAVAALIGDGCDVVLDCVAYGRAHARQLLGLADRIGSAVVISTAAVYEDDQGRGFGTQDRPDGAPRYPVPLPESQRTVPPGDGYGGRKVALERELLAAGDRLPTTLLRAGAIHGPYCRTPRELYFVKRALDGRPVRILAYGGRSRFHPVHVDNIAELVRLAAQRPGSRVLNAGDPQAPTVADIAAAVDAVLGVRGELVLIDGAPPHPHIGSTPWSLAHPLVCDMSAAERELGYRPVTGYLESLPATVAWLAERLADTPDWRAAFPDMAAAYDPMADLFDYAAEDAWLRSGGHSLAS
ncbi:NAD(P)-dependent oxidoreductase [Streptomyces sp. RKCA744]|uniref:NAD-dependent epimerase/dehydratase family protein n=1 Tax=Streptomyces sp. RKCA744 TaxID=2959340 RepID=UPI00209D94AF|nr:NAD(P)-dependent oxidoreductase [Streptomyces sp. RKCA744]MCO8303085.1 NAD(P)-dependent oxidoreductase [Streptomyces sp. RKCA744]